MRRLVGTLKKKIEVQNPTGGFFTVGVYDTDPATAFVLAGKVAEKFIEVTRQDQIQGVRQAGAFSDEQLAIYKDKLDASEKELSRVRRELASAEVANNPVNETNIHYAQALRQTVKANADRSDIAFRRVRERLLGLTSLVPTSDRITGDESIRAIENRLVGYGEEKLLRDLTGSSQVEMPVAQFDDATAALATASPNSCRSSTEPSRRTSTRSSSSITTSGRSTTIMHRSTGSSAGISTSIPTATNAGPPSSANPAASRRRSRRIGRSTRRFSIRRPPRASPRRFNRRISVSA
jgi:hypothetical protein